MSTTAVFRVDKGIFCGAVSPGRILVSQSTTGNGWWRCPVSEPRPTRALGPRCSARGAPHAVKLLLRRTAPRPRAAPASSRPGTRRGSGDLDGQNSRLGRQAAQSSEAGPPPRVGDRRNGIVTRHDARGVLVDLGQGVEALWERRRPRKEPPPVGSTIRVKIVNAEEDTGTLLVTPLPASKAASPPATTPPSPVSEAPLGLLAPALLEPPSMAPFKPEGASAPPSLLGPPALPPASLDRVGEPSSPAGRARAPRGVVPKSAERNRSRGALRETPGASGRGGRLDASAQKKRDETMDGSSSVFGSEELLPRPSLPSQTLDRSLRDGRRPLPPTLAPAVSSSPLKGTVQPRTRSRSRSPPSSGAEPAAAPPMRQPRVPAPVALEPLPVLETPPSLDAPFALPSFSSSARRWTGLEPGASARALRQVPRRPRTPPSPAATLPETGTAVQGRVTHMAAFGAFVELSPGLSGLLHASELRHSRGEGAEAVAAGNALQFVVLSVSRNEQGQPRIRLSQRGMYPEGPAPSTRRSPAQGEEGSTARGRGSAPVSAIRSAFRVSAKAGPEFGVAPDSPPPPSSAIARLRHWWEAQPSSRAPASTALGDALRRMGYAWPDADVEAESAEELPRARAGWTAELGRRVAAKATSLLPELDRLPRAFSVELARPPAPVSHRGFRVAEDSPAEHVRRLAPRAPVSMHERYVASAEANMDWRDMPLGEFARYLKERGEETVQGGDPFRPPLRPLGWFEPVLRRMPRHLRRAGGREAEDWTRRGALEAGTRAWSHLRVKLHGCLAPIPPSYPTRSILCRALPLDACAEASASPPRISAAAAAQLRARSGAGLMACKAALEEACGDFERAMDLLRLKGQSASAARAARTAAQGLLAAEVGPGRRAAACVELRCETDFVARAERFTSCARALARAALGLRGETGPEEAEDGLLDSPVDGLADASTVRGALDQLTLAVGEKVQLAGVRRWEVPQGAAGVFAAYVHAGSGCRDGVLLELRCSDAAAATDAQVWELADNMALQLVACPSVKYVRADQVPEPERARERAVLEEQEDVKARPEAMRAKIVQGRLGKALAEWSLMPQGYVLNPKQTVQQVLDAVSKSVGSELWVSRFVRISVGSSA